MTAKKTPVKKPGTPQKKAPARAKAAATRKKPAKPAKRATPGRGAGATRRRATPAPKLTKIEKDVLELRRAGLRLDVIAEQLSLPNVEAAHAALERALDATLPPSPDEARRLELERLDRLQTALWPKALRGDLPAIHQLAQLTQERMRYAIVVADTPIGATEQATRREIEALGKGKIAPALCAAAIVLAREVDEAQHRGGEPGLVATAARELRMTMSQLRAWAVEVGPAAPNTPEDPGPDPDDPVVVDASRLAEARKRAGR